MNAMHFPAAALLTFTCLALGACATPEGYPSLAVREGERVTGSLERPEPRAYVPPPVEPEQLGRLEALLRQVARAHDNFLASVPEARRAVNAASSARVGSENWAVAQVALADLESIRSGAMIALADINRLYVDAATEGRQVAAIEEARSEAIELVGEENEVISELLRVIGP